MLEDTGIKKYPSYWNWLFREHAGALQDYLNNWIEREAAGNVYDYLQNGNIKPGSVLEEFVRDPYLGYNVLNDWMLNSQSTRTNLERLITYINQPAVFNILVRGMPDSGKTTTVYALVHELHQQGYKIVMVAPFVDLEALPSFIGWKPKIFDLNKGEIGIIDEAALRMSSRASMSKSNKDAFLTMPVGRHIGAKIILITQMASETDIKALRWANVIISKSFADSAMGEHNIERAAFTENPIIEYLKPKDNYANIPSTRKDWSVVISQTSFYALYLPKPAFMTDALSRTYRKISEIIGTDDEAQIEQFALKQAQFMADHGYPAITIYTELGIRGYWKPIEEWMRFTGELTTSKKLTDLEDLDLKGITAQKALRG